MAASKTSACLEISGLNTYFFTGDGIIKAVRDLDLRVPAATTVALVGESGCGKSITALSVLRLVPEPGRVVAGEIMFNGEDLLKLPQLEMRRIRGNRIAMIFQDPMTALNPVLTIGAQIDEVLALHRALTGEQARQRGIAILEQVGIPRPAQRYDDYPHQLSGGMRQRVVIAMALACDPAVLIADEPTTALDVTIQAQIMALLAQQQRQRRMATILISHDLGVVAQNAAIVAIMYNGMIVEIAPVATIFSAAQHPYTRQLLDCIPKPGRRRQRLLQRSNDKHQTEQFSAPFAARGEHIPPMQQVADGHCVRRWS